MVVGAGEQCSCCWAKHGRGRGKNQTRSGAMRQLGIHFVCVCVCVCARARVGVAERIALSCSARTTHRSAFGCCACWLSGRWRRHGQGVRGSALLLAAQRAPASGRPSLSDTRRRRGPTSSPRQVRARARARTRGVCTAAHTHMGALVRACIPAAREQALRVQQTAS